VGSETTAANAIMLYDAAVGENKLLPELVHDVYKQLGIRLQPKSIPSTAEVVEATYKQTASTLQVDTPNNNELVRYFRSKLEADFDTSNPDQLLDYLARAMATMSHLDPSASPFQQQSSLLTGSPTDRTVRLQTTPATTLTPPEVTKFCKSMGSGKLGRVEICKDGSAIFDLPTKRANKLVEAVGASNDDWHLELPLSLPEL
jgi:hypothetical protein